MFDFCYFYQRAISTLEDNNNVVMGTFLFCCFWREKRKKGDDGDTEHRECQYQSQYQSRQEFTQDYL